MPLIIAVVGPFMLMPAVGLNEWGHAFWIYEEVFAEPFHWGFVVFGWSALALGGVLIQFLLRCTNYLFPRIYGEDWLKKLLEKRSPFAL